MCGQSGVSIQTQTQTQTHIQNTAKIHGVSIWEYLLHKKVCVNTGPWTLRFLTLDHFLYKEKHQARAARVADMLGSLHQILPSYVYT